VLAIEARDLGGGGFDLIACFWGSLSYLDGPDAIARAAGGREASRARLVAARLLVGAAASARGWWPRGFSPRLTSPTCCCAAGRPAAP